MRTSILLLSLCCLFSNLWAQDKSEVSFDAVLTKSTLGVNERLRVEFTMNKDGDNFTPPDFSGFRVLMGPSQAISSSWVNGVRSFSKTYSYTLAPTSTGKFTIGQATIEIDGKVYKSLPQEVTVTTAVEKPDGETTVEDVADNNLFLVAEVSKTSPYLNEAVSVVYKLYVGQGVNVTNYRLMDSPKYNNFWSQDIPIGKLQAQSGTYKGRPFKYAVLKKVVLYPQKSGELVIEPLTLDVSVDVPTNRRDFFGGRVYAQTNKTVSAGRRVLQVKSLPEAGKPEGFTGAVGSFSFDVSTSKTSLSAAESLQAVVKVSGKGNLKLLGLPELNLPSALEVYEPEYDEQVRTSLSGMQGSVANSYTVVPNYQGKYPIPAITFSYFDPEAQKYRAISSDEIVVHVTDGPVANVSGADSGTAPANTRQVIVPNGNQFHFIKLDANLVPQGQDHFFGSSRFYWALLLPLLFIPLIILFGKKRKERAEDVAGNKLRRANKLAKKYLGEAKRTLGNKELFYVALERALHNYLKAKLKIETVEFSKDKIRDTLAAKQVDSNETERFIGLLQNCEMARYSPFSNVQMQNDYEIASEVISIMDKQL